MALKSLSTIELRRELERRERGADKLLAKHKALSTRLAEIHAELADLGVDRMPARRGRKPGRLAGHRGPGRPAKSGRRGPRARNENSLPAMLAKALRVGSTVSPIQAAAAVKKAGYKTGSKTFGIQVASALAKSSDFKKTGRGQYLRKGGAAAPAAKRGPKPKARRKTSKRGRKPGRPKGSGKKRAKPAAAPAAAASAS